MIDKATIAAMKTVQEIRLENARYLASEGPAEFARKIESTTQQVNQFMGPNPTRNIGNAIARRIEDAFGHPKGWLDVEHNSASADVSSTGQNPRIVAGPTAPVGPSMLKEPGERFDKNVTPSPLGQRRIPVISYVQAGMMTEVVDPFELGGGFETILTDLDVSGRTFALIIDGPSMLPDFNEGDKVIIDPALSPRPGDFVVAKNGKEEATFKKYRPRGTGENGEMVFELVPLNDDFPVLQSERDHLRIVGVMVEHRKYRRR